MQVLVWYSACDSQRPTYRLKDTRSRLCMPPFDTTVELRACVEDAVVVVLIMHRSGDAIPKHALSQRRKRVDRVLAQECGGG